MPTPTPTRTRTPTPTPTPTPDQLLALLDLPAALAIARRVAERGTAATSPPHLPHISATSPPYLPLISRGTAAELARHRRVAGCASAAAAAAALTEVRVWVRVRVTLTLTLTFFSLTLTEGRSAAELEEKALGETDVGGRVLPSRELLRWA